MSPLPVSYSRATHENRLVFVSKSHKHNRSKAGCNFTFSVIVFCSVPLIKPTIKTLIGTFYCKAKFDIYSISKINSFLSFFLSFNTGDLLIPELDAYYLSNMDVHRLFVRVM